jgi:hypothetical protein
MHEKVDKIEAIIENEKEWRRYVIRKLDDLEKDHNIFKIKAFSFMAVVSFIINIGLKYIGNL